MSEATVNFFFSFVTLQDNIMPHLLHVNWSLHTGIFFVGVPLILAPTVFKHINNNNKLLLSSEFGAEKYYPHLMEKKEEIKQLSLYNIGSNCQGLEKYPALSDCTPVPYEYRATILLCAWWLKSLYIMLSLQWM